MVHVLIIWPTRHPPYNVVSAFIVEDGGVFGQEIDTYTNREMSVSSKGQKIINQRVSIDVTVATTKHKFNLHIGLQCYLTVYLFDIIGIRVLSGWMKVLARKSMLLIRGTMAQDDRE